jgi:acyl carrier protein
VIIEHEASRDMTKTFDGLRDIIVRDFELPPERLMRDTPLEQIELDSLAVTELVFSLEDEFQVTADNAVPAFVTLGDIADYIDRLVAERASGSSAAAAASGSIASAPGVLGSAAASSGAPSRVKKARKSGGNDKQSSGDSPAPPPRKKVGRASRPRGPAGAARAAKPQASPAPKRRRNADNARSDGSAR